MTDKIRKMVVFASQYKSVISNRMILSFVNQAIECGIYDVLIIDSLEEDSYNMDMSFMSTNVKRVAYSNYDDMIHAFKRFVKSNAFALFFDDFIIAHDSKSSLSQLLSAFEQYGQTTIGVKDVGAEGSCEHYIIKGKTVDNHLSEVGVINQCASYEVAESNDMIIGQYILLPEVFKSIKFRSMFTVKDLIHHALNDSNQAIAYNLEGELKNMTDNIIDRNISIG